MSGTEAQPARPERSTARGGGLTTMEGVSAAASDAYNRAPDLGISSTANSTYQRAPDLGVGATISSVLGYSSNGSNATGQQETSQAQAKAPNVDEEDEERVIRNPDERDQSTSSPSTNKNDNNKEQTYSSRREESKAKGPSNQDRIGKSQNELGTETDIPTTAGMGTTASADQTNKKALDKANSEGKTNKAHVPEDYEAISGPGLHRNTSPSPSPRSSSRQLKGGRDSAPTSPKGGTSSLPSNNNTASSPKFASRPTNSRKSSGNHTASHDTKYVTGLQGTDGSPIEMEKRRSLGEKIKDQVKGEIKIIAGTVTGKDDKVIEGLAIKHGDHS